MRNFLFIIAAAVILLTSCKQEIKEVNIIPEPVEISYSKGAFNLSNSTNLCFFNIDYNDPTVKYIETSFPKFFGITPQINKDTDCSKNCICFEIFTQRKDKLGDEGYELHIDKHHISIQANTTAGLFYGFQTLRQVAPPEVLLKPQENIQLQSLNIVDYPRFSWRGSHLDVCRHFFDIDFVKKHLDMLAAHKINKFHWHLTDDHGWRIQIDKYPELTNIGAWRVDRSDVPWVEGKPPQPGEKATYGGFYTKDQMREIVEYASVLNIDVMPEVELPGHCCAILAAYPELGCTGKPEYVQIGPYWPPSAILCAGNDQTMQFLYDVIDEVIEIFPYEYIHIGGDEAFKDWWHTCKKCNKRMKELGITDYEHLQGWMVTEVEKHINSRGRKMVGWDEILEGGVTKNATIMSWRGKEGATEAAKHGNYSILCPTSYCYIDYYQAEPATQPTSIGGFVPLKKVYSLEPVPEELNNEEAKYILGAQCNLWTEFIFTPHHAEYMLWPRLAALAEVAWSQKENKDWYRFRDKVEDTKQRLGYLGYNYCEGNFKPTINTINKDNRHLVTIESDVKGTEIYYTTDGSSPTDKSQKYNQPFEVNDFTTIKAQTYYNGEARESAAETNVFISKLTGKKIFIAPKPSEKYAANYEYTLSDGIMGSKDHNDGRWLGFQTDKVSVIIENNGQEIEQIIFNNNVNQGSWIFEPIKIEVFSSEKGVNYDLVMLKENSIVKNYDLHNVETVFDFDERFAPKFIKIEFTGLNALPDWHEHSGEMPWIFIDEIILK
ncbi:MAG: family 20 glycosylhydrolase [Bacteroidales bacterium]|jgi:hexosaminidase|nr:family 20 glycosylhydrolase [Bacteroidales bacterium]